MLESQCFLYLQFCHNLSAVTGCARVLGVQDHTRPQDSSRCFRLRSLHELSYQKVLPLLFPSTEVMGKKGPNLSD